MKRQATVASCALLLACFATAGAQDFRINDKEYFENAGAGVMVFSDNYSEGHQGGVTLVLNGHRRADWSYIPGGVAPGTNLIRPDLPELLDFPYLWQEGEYCMGGYTSWFMYMALASDRFLNANN